MVSKPDKEKLESVKVSKIIEEAMDLERTANTLRRERGRETAEEIGSMYEKAGDLRMRARDFINAEDNYVQAQRYGFPYDQERREEISEKINRLRLERRSYNFFKGINSKSLGKKFAVVSILTLTFALFFVTSNLTGFSILNISSGNSRWIGSCFFVCGLIFAFVYLKSKNKTLPKKKNKK